MTTQEPATPRRQHTDRSAASASSRDALRQSEQRFHLLVDSVQDYAIFMLDPEGHVVSWNEGAWRIKQYSAAEILGQHFSVFYTPQDREHGVPQRGLRIAAEAGRFEAEGWRVRKDGSLFWANVVITALRDADGQLVGFGKVTRDLTERRKAEEARAHLWEEQAARAVAEQTLTEREEFLAVAAHELRTPITSLTGFAQLVLRQLDRPGTLEVARLRQSVQVVDRQATKVARLIDQLLDVSRLQIGKVVLEREDADLVALVEEAVQTAQMRTSQHALTVQAPAALPAFVDPIRLEQVFTNLLNNAIKYSPDGGAIAVEVLRPTPAVAQVAVRDHGLGIPPEQRARIFERFYQAHAQRHLSGLGLGLYLSQEIVTLHGGRVTVEFPSDGGTRFIVSLPTSEAATLAPMSSEEEPPLPETTWTHDP